MAALVAIWTLRIIIQQPKDLFRPKVIIGNVSFGHCHAEGENVLRTAWQDTVADYVTFEVSNAGNGIAEDLIINTHWDIKEAIQFIKYSEFFINSDGKELTIKTTFDKTNILATY